MKMCAINKVKIASPSSTQAAAEPEPALGSPVPLQCSHSFIHATTGKADFAREGCTVSKKTQNMRLISSIFYISVKAIIADNKTGKIWFIRQQVEKPAK